MTDSSTRRILCLKCRQPQFSCYCSTIKSFDPGIKFVILIHPIEYYRRIATGRMAHLCLKNSELILGTDFENCLQVNELLDNKSFSPFVLYPGRSAIHLNSSPKTLDQKSLVFVIDGTWTTARKMLNRSPRLAQLPQITFSSRRRSAFRVRKQPADHCLSTIEAIHEVLDITHGQCSIEKNLQHESVLTRPKEHDVLIDVFTQMIDRQLELRGQANVFRKEKHNTLENLSKV